MRPEEREALRTRFGFRCGYCGVSEIDVGAELTIDHYQPRSRGGGDDPENWVYSCFTCNNHKGDLWAPHSSQRILHPLYDDLPRHINEQPEGTLTGLTETGRFHIERLQLNRPALVAHRRSQIRQAELAQKLEELLHQQDGLRHRVEMLEQTLIEVERRLTSL